MNFCAIAPEMANDASRELHHPGGMDGKAIRRAALVTLRRAILERFLPGAERTAWLRWLGAPTGFAGLALLSWCIANWATTLAERCICARNIS